MAVSLLSKFLSTSPQGGNESAFYHFFVSFNRSSYSSPVVTS